MSIDSVDFSSVRLSYGITPPKITCTEEKRRTIAEAQSLRIAALPIDALVVYDLQDESSRTDAVRPFPFLRAIDPLDYALEYLQAVPQKKIVYRSVSGLDSAGLRAWLKRLHESGGAAVFVGAPSQSQQVSLGLGEAYRIRSSEGPKVPLGGVLIAERHQGNAQEHERVLRKIGHGCSFFVTQAAYSVTASKNVLSDLYYRAHETSEVIPPILVTLSPCGSQKTLDFMDWLGVSVPRWLQNELVHAKDILQKSVDLSLAGFEEIHAFATEKGIPLGCNVESVSLAKDEIDASVEMVHRARKILGRSG